MPSILTHALVGASIAAAYLYWRGERVVRRDCVVVAAFVIAGLIPDTDIWLGHHRRLGHNYVTAFALPALAAAIATLALSQRQHRVIAWWLPAALSMHIWFDLLAPVNAGSTPLFYPAMSRNWVPTGHVIEVFGYPVLEHGAFLVLAPVMEVALSHVSYHVAETFHGHPMRRAITIAVGVIRPMGQIIFILVMVMAGMIAPQAQSFS